VFCHIYDSKEQYLHDGLGHNLKDAVNVVNIVNVLWSMA
jgi:hypothetical protein